MQFAGLNYVFITAIMYTGAGIGKRAVPDVFSTRQGSYSRPRAQFFPYQDLPRPSNIYFFHLELLVWIWKKKQERRVSCLQNIMSFCRKLLRVEVKFFLSLFPLWSQSINFNVWRFLAHFHLVKMLTNIFARFWISCYIYSAERLRTVFRIAKC